MVPGAGIRAAACTSIDWLWGDGVMLLMQDVRDWKGFAVWTS